ncbi:MAG TPA: hypothetical protein VF006_20765 [Longimicrobium sp.]
MELGSEAGWAAFLGRPAGGGSLAILLMQAEEGSREHRLQVVRRLDSGVRVGRTTCTACGKVQVGWPRYCDECRTDLAATPADAEADLLVPGGHQLLGTLTRAEGGAPVHFAREVATGRVVGLAEKARPDGSVELTRAWAPDTAAAWPPRRLTTARAAGLALIAAALLVAAVVAARGPRIQADAVANAPGGVDTAGTQAGNPPVVTPPSTVLEDKGGPAAPVNDSSPSAGAPSSTPAQTEKSATVAGGGRREQQKGSAPGTPATAGTRPAPSPPSPVPTPQGVEATIGRYASAVASGQTSRITRAYPGITPAEVDRWNRFFAPLGPDAGLRASHEVVSGPTLDGNRAEVIFTLTLSYQNPAGTPEYRSLPLRAVLRWTGTAWSLQEVRLLQ